MFWLQSFGSKDRLRIDIVMYALAPYDKGFRAFLCEKYNNTDERGSIT